jgi:hypothetical protein
MAFDSERILRGNVRTAQGLPDGFTALLRVFLEGNLAFWHLSVLVLDAGGKRAAHESRGYTARATRINDRGPYVNGRILDLS